MGMVLALDDSLLHRVVAAEGVWGLELDFSYEVSRTAPHHGVNHLSGVVPITSESVKGHLCL